MLRKLHLLPGYWHKAIQHHFIRTSAISTRVSTNYGISKYKSEQIHSDVKLLQRIFFRRKIRYSTLQEITSIEDQPKYQQWLSFIHPPKVFSFKQWHGGKKNNGNFDKKVFQEISLWFTGILAIYGGIFSHSWFSRNTRSNFTLNVLDKNCIHDIHAIDSKSSLPPYDSGATHEKLQISVEKLDEAVALFQQKSDECCGSMLNKFALGYRKKSDYKKAFELFEMASSFGHAPSLYNLGLCYEHGHGVDVSLEKAAKCYQQAADKGHLKSIFNIATFHYEGYGCLIDESRDIGLSYMKKAADQGLLAAQQFVALKYVESRNWHEAFRYFKMAADQHHDMSSIHKVALCLEKGLGVEKDIDEAMKYLFLSAEMGYGLSQLHLSDSYKNGVRGMKQDTKESLKWFKLALQNGQCSSQQLESLGKHIEKDSKCKNNSYDTMFSLLDVTKNNTEPKVQDSLSLSSMEKKNYDDRDNQFYDIRSMDYCVIK